MVISTSSKLYDIFKYSEQAAREPYQDLSNIRSALAVLAEDIDKIKSAIVTMHDLSIYDINL